MPAGRFQYAGWPGEWNCPAAMSPTHSGNSATTVWSTRMRTAAPSFPSPQNAMSSRPTPRALLGVTLIRRLAARTEPLPAVIDTIFDEVVRQAREGNVEATGSVDLDLQDELARAAHMPRIEPMFVRLTLQVRLFVTLMGLTYAYPKDDIVEDGVRILAAIRAHDVEAAVTAWRSKVDNAARYIMEQLPAATG
jgi:DNA-binding GntR family transcriptional regulator